MAAAPADTGEGAGHGTGRIAVWDLPTRLFHWLLVLAVASACVSAHRDGEAALALHFYSGYTVLALLGFRLLWGFAGSRYARFAQFVRGPRAVLAYLRTLPQRPGSTRYPGYPGHNPLGALSVLALLAACLLQGLSGLYTEDDIASAGPLVRFASEAFVHRMGHWHAWGEILLYGVVGLHLGAIAFYALYKRENLVGAMLSGYKPDTAAPASARQQAPGRRDGEVQDEGSTQGTSGEPADPGDGNLLARAALLFALSAALLVYIARLT